MRKRRDESSLRGPDTIADGLLALDERYRDKARDASGAAGPLRPAGASYALADVARPSV